MLEALLVCDSCQHGVAFHTGGGCDVFRCHCSEVKERLVARAVEEDVREYRRRWRNGSSPP